MVVYSKSSQLYTCPSHMETELTVRLEGEFVIV